MATAVYNKNVRYEPEESPPLAIAIGAGVQSALVVIAPLVVTVVIVGRVAGQSAEYIAWAVFAALVIGGATTALQSSRFGPIGSGHVLIMGTSGAFIAVSAAALMDGGPALLATLVVISSFIQFALAARLALLRRIFTPTVAGTVIILIAVTIMPLIFNSVAAVPGDSPDYGGAVTALVTLLVILALILRGPSVLRLWSPIIGIVVGCLTAALFGNYDLEEVLSADWIGVPFGGWPGYDFSFGVEFWTLLPAFLVVTLIGAIETLGDGVAIQQVSRRNPRSTDFRVVQGAINGDGIGNLLSGLAGTLPNTTYSTSIPLAEVTGIGSRRVGILIGATLAVIAFFPKAVALLISIPAPVAAAYLVVLVALLFVQGIKMIFQGGIDQRKTLVAGVSFWMGIGFENGLIFPGLFGDGFVAAMFANGMTSGAIIALLLMTFIELTSPRSRHLRTVLDEASLPSIDQFLRQFASNADWSSASIDRLAAAGEETVAILMQSAQHSRESERRLAITARMDGDRAEIEFVTTAEPQNVEDQITYLSELPPVPDEREVSFRLLWHYVESVRHQKYQGLDVVSVRVAGTD